MVSLLPATPFGNSESDWPKPESHFRRLESHRRTREPPNPPRESLYSPRRDSPPGAHPRERGMPGLDGLGAGAVGGGYGILRYLHNADTVCDRPPVLRSRGRANPSERRARKGQPLGPLRAKPLIAAFLPASCMLLSRGPPRHSGGGRFSGLPRRAAERAVAAVCLATSRRIFVGRSRRKEQGMRDFRAGRGGDRSLARGGEALANCGAARARRPNAPEGCRWDRADRRGASWRKRSWCG